MLSLNVLSIDSASICWIPDIVESVWGNVEENYWCYNCRYVARWEKCLFILYWRGGIGTPPR